MQKSGRQRAQGGEIRRYWGRAVSWTHLTSVLGLRNKSCPAHGPVPIWSPEWTFPASLWIQEL